MKLFNSSWLIAVNNIIFQTDLKKEREIELQMSLPKALKYLGPSPDSLQKIV